MLHERPSTYRYRRKLQKPRASEQELRIAQLTANFKRALDHQRKTNADILAALVRVLTNPTGMARVDADRLRTLIREIVKETK